MSTIYVLTLSFFISTSNGVAISSVTHEYTSISRCETAKQRNMDNLKHASVILATCTTK